MSGDCLRNETSMAAVRTKPKEECKINRGALRDHEVRIASVKSSNLPGDSKLSSAVRGVHLQPSNEFATHKHLYTTLWRKSM